jgi:hypothetical protein
MVRAASIAKAAGLLAEVSVRAREAVIRLLYGIEENSRLGSSFVANVEREGKVLYDAEQG